jgi:hypothetical protein
MQQLARTGVGTEELCMTGLIYIDTRVGFVAVECVLLFIYKSARI